MSARHLGGAARKARTLIASALLLLGASACNLVLGIDEATLEDSTSTSTTSSTSSSGTGGAGGDGPLTCAKYCDVVNAACTAENTEYFSNEVCLTMCATFDPGMPGDTTNDSLNCRYGHALKAAADPVHECQKAGPLAIECTNPCSAFCLLDVALCPPGEGLFPYASAAECKTACMAYTYLVSAEQTDPTTVGDILFLAGNTLNCRIYHLESAIGTASSSKTTHCPHTAADSATCVD